MKIVRLSFLLFTLIFKVNNLAFAQENPSMERYNVVWSTPSKDVSGVMPIGNGDLGAGVYAIENGDLFLLLSKNNAYNYMGDLFKTGRVRIKITSNPFKSGTQFRQVLDLQQGCIRLNADNIKLKVWVDANNPIYHVDIQSNKKVKVEVYPDLWTRFDHCAYNTSNYYSSKVLRNDKQATQDVVLSKENQLIWYYAVGDRSVYEEDLSYYQVDKSNIRHQDPFKYNTFGNLVESNQMKLIGNHLSGKGKTFNLKIHSLCEQTAHPAHWIRQIKRQAKVKRNHSKDWTAHQNWWNEFWNKSWIVASNNNIPSIEKEKLTNESTGFRRKEHDQAAVVSQNYNVFRFLMACQSRGTVPTKFNGGIFTQQLKLDSADGLKRSGEKIKSSKGIFSHEDDRLWGRRFTFQNQRLLYWPLLAMGDYELLKPFFNYYLDLLPIRKAITKAWYGHEGAYYRENIEPTGAERDCGKDGRPSKLNIGEASDYYHQLYFTSGLELVTMMIEYVHYSGDSSFMKNKLVPFAREIMLFYDKQYPRDSTGKLFLSPAQVLETYWLAENPSPDIAGLKHGLEGLISLNCGTRKDKDYWQTLLKQLPPIPTNSEEGETYLLPAQKYSIYKNAENGELYPVFPFNQYGVAFGNQQIVANTMKRRTAKNAYGGVCWTQDQIDYAYAGNASEAAKGLVNRFSTTSPQCRFPLFGKETPDSCPDFDHFGSGSVAFQRMIVQEDNAGHIVLFPAWPKEWDVNFKIFIRDGAYIAGQVEQGEITHWEIYPKTLRNKVIVHPLQ